MSFQEDIIADLTGFALGRRYLFRPDNYRKGTATREPADLAWFCRDTLVLMYMTDTSQGWQRDEDHNLRQARGWLRAWKAGVPLVGRNPSRDFLIPYDSSLATIVLSISADKLLSEIAVHDDIANVLNVDLCATVSQALIHRFTDRGAGITDLAGLLKLWQDIRSVQPDLTDTQWFDSIRGLSMNNAAEQVGWRIQEAPSNYLDRTTRYIRGLRAIPPEPSDELDLDINAFFADMAFVEQFQLLLTIGKAEAIVKSGILSIELPITLHRYSGIIRVVAYWADFVNLEPPSQVDFFYLSELESGITTMHFHTLRTPTRAWETIRGHIGTNKTGALLP
jgi:hypothetical protein